MKPLEVIPTKNGGHTKITIAKDRVSIKVRPDDPNLDRLKQIGEFCRTIDVSRTLRGKLGQVTLDYGIATLYSCGQEIGGYLYLTEPMRFAHKETQHGRN